ncbi:hypothetical protein RD792_016238 [Penstemon davidsonii]|uniref:BZIP domain-containing protein n=1 Tax=Penstemon davidsonii TaxID=160366 RepID=A0ABR0CKM3_9LAMI|nr:hypothetical protein RD792_016238 [Penstemon davidsonii]
MGSSMNFNNFGEPDGNGGGTTYPLARQSSVYSLTFDEFQNTMGGGSGKCFGSMNMEEFLKSIWTAEEGQAMVSSTIGGGVAPIGNLQRQGSLTLPRTMSLKTVDEVWKDVLKETVCAKDEMANESSNLGPSEPTLSEMTLEEFLVRAGMVRDDIQPSERPNNVGPLNDFPPQNGNNSGLIQFQQSSQNHGSSSNQLTEPNNTVFSFPNLGTNGSSQRPPQQPQYQLQPLFPKQTTVAFSAPSQHGNHLRLDAIVKSNVETPSPSPTPYHFGEGGRGRRTPGSLEKVVERRQRRMIKNRESAARSRDRKQAYTLELEAEIAKLNEMNEELRKKQEEIMEMQKNQILETMNTPGGGKRICLRRTQTGPW